MTDETDPFGDLDDSLADEPNEAGDDEPESPSERSVGSSSTSRTTSETQHRDPQERPAFPFDAVKQSALYARDETWEEFEAAMNYEAERSLHEDDYSSIEGRELHEATLLVAAENPELVAEKVRELRNDIA